MYTLISLWYVSVVNVTCRTIVRLDERLGYRVNTTRRAERSLHA